MKFSEMQYTRPDLDQIRAEGSALIEKLKNAASADEAAQIYLDWDKMSAHIDTMFTLAYIRHSINTEDAFYDKEIEFLDENMPHLQELSVGMMKVMLESPFRPQLEERFGALMFRNAEIQLKTFDPAIIPDMQEENKLTTEYAKLLASAQIDFQGEKRTLAQMTPFKQSADDETRRAAWQAEGEYYAANRAKLDQLYDDLTAVRTRMGRKLGYDNYVQLGYYRMQRNDYTKEDVERFRDAVRRYVVPLADRLYREQAKRIGVPYPLTFADAALSFRSGNARPAGSADDILAHAREMYHEMSPETAEFIDVMLENELMDVLAKKGKEGGGYCTGIADYKVPFIFANFNGTQGDVEVVTHEAGHAFAGYQARNIVPSSNQNPTMESCEIHSMSMEFFAWPWAEGFFKGDTQKFYYGHLAGAITFIPYGTMVDHFQHIVYENPDMTPDERHAAWKKLLGEYMPWLALDGSPTYGEGKGWQRQHHIYESPFYYIDYCLAQTVALQFWAKIQQNREDAWKRYMALVSEGGRKTFSGLVATAGLDTPFGADALREVAETATAWLDAFDKDALK